MDFSVRAATSADEALLRRMLGFAATWDRDAPERERQRAIASPEVSRYVDGWGRPEDFGVIAEDRDGRGLGAAWARSFPKEEPGYGFIDEDTPELSIAVEPRFRGRGVGRALLEDLLAAARRRGVRSMSLSVERDNPAVALYRRVDFEIVERSSETFTMRIALG